MGGLGGSAEEEPSGSAEGGKESQLDAKMDHGNANGTRSKEGAVQPNGALLGQSQVSQPEPGSQKASNGLHLTNGVSGANGVHNQPNGVGVGQPTLAEVNGSGISASASYQNLPPEIKHISEGYVPLSRLITRLSQECFNRLGSVVTQMADMPGGQGPPSGPNGAYMNGNAYGADSQASAKKRELLLQFGQDYRTKFTKLLVLSKWARKAEAISRVVDLKAHLDEYMRIYTEVPYYTGEMKRTLYQAKMPNPDLETALEVLTTGRVEGFPDVRIICVTSKYLLSPLTCESSLGIFHKSRYPQKGS